MVDLVERGRCDRPRFLSSSRIADLPPLPRFTRARGRSRCLARVEDGDAIGGRRRHAGTSDPRPGSAVVWRPRLAAVVRRRSRQARRHTYPGHSPTIGNRPPTDPERVGCGHGVLHWAPGARTKTPGIKPAGRTDDIGVRRTVGGVGLVAELALLRQLTRPGFRATASGRLGDPPDSRSVAGNRPPSTAESVINGRACGGSSATILAG